MTATCCASSCVSIPRTSGGNASLNFLAGALRQARQQWHDAHIFKPFFVQRMIVMRHLALVSYLQDGGNGASSSSSGGAAGSEEARIALGHCVRRLKSHWRLGVMLLPLLSMRAARPLGVEEGGPELALPGSAGARGDEDAEAAAARSQVRAGAIGIDSADS